MARNNLRLLKIFFRDWKSRLLSRPAHLTIFVTSVCNYRCRMCFYWWQIENQDKKELTLSEFKKIASRFPSFTSMALTGGEPFLRDDLVDIAKVFYQQSCVRSIFISTNASLPQRITGETEKILKSCPEALVTICLSLDGLGKDHDRIRGVKGAYQKFLATHRRLKTLQKKYLNLEINVNFAYTKDNQGKLWETYRHSTEKLGVKNFNVSLVRGDTRKKETKKIDINRYEQLTQKMDQESIKKEKISKFGSLFREFIFARTALVKQLAAQVYQTNLRTLPCLAGQFNLVITEEGDVYPCEMIFQKMGSLRTANYDIQKTLTSPRAKKIVKKIRTNQCACTHEFNLPDNILYSPKGFLKLLGYWVRLKFGRIKQPFRIRTILEFNVFDENYAAYIRSRKIRDVLLEEGYQVTYSEANYQGKDKTVINIVQADSFLGYFWGTIQRAYHTLRLPYDLLFLHQLSPMTAPLILLAKARGKRVIFDWDDLASGVQSSGLRAFWCRLAEAGWVVRLTDAVISHNQTLMDLAKKKGQKSVFMVPQGVDSQMFSMSKNWTKGRVLKKKLSLEGKKVIIFVACFNTGGVRDLDVILKAYKKIENRRRDVFLLALGGGPLLKEYQKKATQMGLKNYRFYGPVLHQRVPEFLSLAEIGLVFMSDNLGNRMKISLKTLEYLTMPIKVVGHLVGESKKAFGQFCYLSQPSSEFLSQRIIDCLEKRGPKKEARKWMIANHDWLVVKKYLNQALKSL